MIDPTVDATTDNLSVLPSSDGAVLRQQAQRRAQIKMSAVSYLATLSLVAFLAYKNVFPTHVVALYTLVASVGLGLAYFLVRLDLNLRLRDPNLAMVQIAVSVPPSLIVMYSINPGQIRGVFVLLAVVPVVWGILSLTTRQLLRVGLLYLASYGALLLVLWWRKPDAIDWIAEGAMGIAFVIAITQISIIGGFITRLRERLRNRNTSLQRALLELAELAARDPLTGAFNRRHLFEVLNNEVQRSTRSGQVFSICMIDIDRFKRVNDRYGHQAGDAVINQLAGTILKDLRCTDCLGRYGGEEFVLVFPQTELAGALVKAERVRQQIEVLIVDGLPAGERMTISVGVAQYRLTDSLELTLGRADAALYRAKADGRNRIVSEAVLSNRVPEVESIKAPR